MPTRNTVFVLIGALILGACISLSPPTPRPVETAGPFGGPGPRTAGAVARSGNRDGEVLRVCRGAGRRGWVAIDYVTDSLACPANRGRKAAYRTALITRYDRQPVGAELTVCADQPVPRNWDRARFVEGDGSCASDPPKEGPTVMLIRRVR
jgi:hypothetical protein